MLKYLLFAAVVTCSSFGFSSVNDESKVVQVAKDNLNKFLSQIPAGSETQFGFSDQNEISTAVVGRPYHVLVLTNEFYNSHNAFGANSIVESNEWRVPIMVNGVSKVLLTVNNQNDTWQASNLSGAGLAAELQQATKDLNSEDTYYILRVYPLTSDFLVDVPAGNINDARFIPLTSARMAMPSLVKNAYSLTEVLSTIKKAQADQQKN